MKTIAEINRAHAEIFDGFYTLVYGEGDSRAHLMLVGEAPGAKEEMLRRPFVGTAGKNLDVFLAGIGLRREALYITNAVKFRPTKEGVSGRLSNRPPTGEEVSLFRPWLLEELAAVSPRVVATLGNTALRAVTGNTALTIGETHGIPRPLGKNAQTIVFPLYHPASIIYRRALLGVYEADVARLRAYLEEN